VKLTGRQREFLSSFLDLYQEAQHPLHYSEVGARLRVSPATAYDMLRLLESRGLASSEYVLPERAGAGRSSIVFFPTQRAMSLMTELARAEWDTKEWPQAKERILQALREGRGTDYEDLLEEILLRIPEEKLPMLYATEMITAVLLSVHQLKEKARVSGLLYNLRQIGLPEEVALGALGGLTLGLSLVENANRRITSLLLSYSQKYHEHLGELSAESKKNLWDFAQEIMRIVGA